jgi:hypothetical protein
MLDKDYESMDLIAVCFITFLWLLLDLLSALVKSNFLNILAALAILGIFILRCFDKHYVRMCIIGIFMSFVFDLIWLLTMSNVKQHSCSRFGTLPTLLTAPLNLSLYIICPTY